MSSTSSNAFFIFLHEYRKILKENSTETNNAVQTAQMAGEKWRQMANDEKLIYFVWARKNQQQKKFVMKRIQERTESLKRKQIKNQSKPHFVMPGQQHITSINYIN